MTLVLVGSFQKKDVATTSSSTASSQGTASASKSKSKNKKKKKSKGAVAVNAVVSVNDTVVEEKKDASTSEDDNNSRSLPDTNPVEQAEVTQAKESNDSTKNGKPKKKKKPKASKAQASNSVNAPSKTSAKENEAKQANDNSRKKDQISEDAQLARMIAAQTQPPKPKEEEWIVEGPKNKKKTRSQKVKAAPSTTTNPNTPAPPPSTESVTVDAKKIGIIIGPKGATMKAIEEATGCKLDVNAPAKDGPPTKGPQKATVVLSGGADRDAIAKAKKAINELATKGYATLLQSDSTFGEFSITVHPRYLSEIVGPGGRTIQALQSALDVKITIPSTDWKPNTIQVGQVKLCKVGIAGAKDNSKQAKQVIQSLMKYHHHEITHPGLVHESVYVEPEFFHCIIGPRGSEIKHIKGNFKVEVYMPNEDSETEDVLVVGKQVNVDRAIAHISKLIDRDSERREKKYNDEYY